MKGMGEMEKMEKGYVYETGKVSVVSPVFNGEGYLAGMLDSVLGQTYPRVEMILVDDGSEDGQNSWVLIHCIPPPRRKSAFISEAVTKNSSR